MSSPASKKTASRGGPSRGGSSRGGGGRGRGGSGGRRGRGGRKPPPKSASAKRAQPSSNNLPVSTKSVPETNPATKAPSLRDEEVLIAFMPYIKSGDDATALQIHEDYQISNDQQSFMKAARDFVASKQQTQLPQPTAPAPQPVQRTPPANSNSNSIHKMNGSHANADASGTSVVGVQDSFEGLLLKPSSNPQQGNFLQPSSFTAAMNNSVTAFELEENLGRLLQDDTAPPSTSEWAKPSQMDKSFSPQIQQSPQRQPLYQSSNPSTMHFTSDSLLHAPSTPVMNPFMNQIQQQQQHHNQQHSRQSTLQPITPPRRSNASTPVSSPYWSTTSTPLFLMPRPQTPDNNPMLSVATQKQSEPASLPTLGDTNNKSSAPTAILQARVTPSALGVIQSSHAGISTPSKQKKNNVADATPSEDNNNNGGDHNTNNPTASPTKAEKAYQPKRVWTRLEEQPGRVFANNIPVGNTLNLRPRQELTAKWILPLSYLQKRSVNLRESLQSLAVGLFRRGCTENGSQASIVSKEVLSEGGRSYPYEVQNNYVIGSIPFYSPRTPGNVVFRLYWQDEPLYTLATSCSLMVKVGDELETTVRFILSNFKGRKVNPTSLSSLHSLALVLEQANTVSSDSVGRAVWGCVCEARKVLDACANEYAKTTSKLVKMEAEVEELKEAEEAEDGSQSGPSDLLKEKTRALMSGRASCERKWRDSQLAFASILRAIVANPSMTMVLRKDLVTKMRLEYELWCPLCEEFAIPSEDAKMWYEPLANIHPINGQHFRLCQQFRFKMQAKMLGFEPSTVRLNDVLFPGRGKHAAMDPAAVNVFNQLSAAMGQMYQELYVTSDRILQERESVRLRIEQAVQECDCFPPGTKVAIFGSAANGFGSPESDLDMCLQLPNGSKLPDDEDATGSNAMAKLAELLEAQGMLDVDTARLTARIPIIRFNFPKSSENGGEPVLVECDLSMSNPLAVINTSLLRIYAEINPVTRVLASIIKRWAKARDINNPARHTLSSYGYIIMLIHFLTCHQRTGNGLVASVLDRDGSPLRQDSRVAPLLPNLQWMDRTWLDAPPGTPYRELSTRPNTLIPHPIEEKVSVNAHFFHPSDKAQLEQLRRLFPGEDLSLAIVLASFFRYYAYDFDYKRHVVSLHSTASRGLVEREIKAELDGWRNYSAALTIEDPFETFYDVAHVLRGGYYHRIRREFAMAYSKIVDAVSGNDGAWNKGNLRSMSGLELIDWICEPIAVDKDDAS